MVLEELSKEKVDLSSDGALRSWHSAYRDDDGRLVVEWLEYRDPAPYDHADTISFSTEQETALRTALGDADPQKAITKILAERFTSYWAVREFAKVQGIKFEEKTDFYP